ncbi:hypothetical protein D3C81_1882070 [compost metagenome]
MIARNCSAVCSRDCAVTVALSACAGPVGNAPSSPAVTWVFCAWIAVRTSEGIRSNARSLFGSSQMRIA